MRALALGGVAGPVLFTVVTIVCASLRPGYSHLNEFISELGATGSSHAALMNYAGFVPTGLLLAAFGISVSRLLPGQRVGVLASVLVTAFGVGISTAGVLSCDPGCSQSGGSLTNLLHNRISPLAFLLAIVGACLLAVGFRRSDEWRSLWVYSAATSVVALLSFVALASSLETRHLTGLWQRLLLAALFTWCGVIGLRAYRRSGDRFAAPARG